MSKIKHSESKEKGAITLFVLLACLFFTLILVGTYISSLGKLQTQEQNIEQIQENYAREISQKDEIYEKLAKNSSISLKANPLTKTKEVTLTGNATIKGGDDVKITAWAITKGNATTPPSSSDWNNITPVSDIEITKNVTENGEYTFWIKDSDGEIVPSRTITISNIDTISPEPGTIIAKKNDENGEEISIPSNKTITSNENVYIEKIDGKDVDENGNEDSTSETTTTMTVKKDGLLYTDPEGKPTEKGEGPFKLTEDGTYTITVITEDEAGNSSENEYVVVIDKVVPVLALKENSETGNTYQSGNWTNNDLYGSITIDTSKNRKQVEKYQYSTNGVVWFDISDTPDENGKINFNNYSKSDDKISFILQEDLEKSIYIRAVYTDKTSSKYADTKSIKIDKTAPEITDTSSTTSSITFKATDGASGIIGYEITTSSTKPTEFTDCAKTYNLEKTIEGLKQETTYYIWVKDEAGNVNEIKTINTGEVTDLDSANTTFKQEPTGWTNQNVEVTTKTSVTGYTLQTTKTPSNESSWVTVNNSTGEPKQTFTNNGTLYARLTDGINTGEQATYNVKNIDKDAPVINTALNSSNVKSNEFTLNVGVADALSGLGKIQWYYKSSTVSGYTMEEEVYTQLNGNETGTTTAVTKSKTFTGLESGTYNAYIVIYDVAGNSISTKSTPLNVNLADIPSNITFNPNPSGWTNGNVIVDASTTETGYTLQTSKNGTNWSNETSQTFTENGTIYAVLTDGINFGEIKTYDVDKIDKEKPAITISTITTNSIKFTATDSESGIIGYAITTSTTEPSAGKFTTVENTKSITQTITNLNQKTDYYIWVKDEAGNISRTNNSITTNGVPSLTDLTFKKEPEGWTNQNVKVTASTTMDISGYVLQTSKDNSTWEDTASQTFEYNAMVYARLKDSTGQTGDVVDYLVDNIDKEKPIVSEVTATTNSVTIKATDNASGIIEYAVTTASAEPSEFTSCGNTLELTTTITGLKQKTTYYVWVKDEAGNISEAGKSIITSEVPTLTGLTFTKNPSNWTNGNVVATASTTMDITGYTLQTSKDGTSYTDVNTQTFEENGTMYARLRDDTNQYGTATPYSISNIDKTLPVITEITTTTNSVTIKATDEESGIVGYTATTTDVQPTSFTSCDSTKSLEKTVTGLKQSTTYYVWVKDQAGNVNLGYRINTLAVPTITNITFSKNPSTWTNSAVEVTASTTMDITGYTLQTSKDGTSYEDTSRQTFTENGTIYARLKDITGQTGEAVKTNVTNIDKTKPTITAFTATTNSVTIEAKDEESGIIGYAVTTSNTAPTEFTTIDNIGILEVTISGKTQNTTYYAWVKDEAGNVSDSGKSVTTLKVPDADITFSQDITGWTNKDVKVTATSNVSGYTLLTSKNSTSNFSQTDKQVFSSNGIMYAVLSDGTQIGKSASYNVTNIDKQAPVITGVSASSNAIKIQATDKEDGKTENEISKIIGYAVTTTNTQPTSFTTVTATAELDVEVSGRTQNTTYYVWVKDQAGNVSSSQTIKTASVSGNITITLNPSVWTNKDVVATASTTSGYTIETSKDGNSWSTSTSQTFTSNGTMYARLVDSSEQIGTTANKAVDKIDKTKPVVTSVSSTTNSVTIKATDNASGIIGYAVTTASAEPSEFTSCGNTLELTTTITGLKQKTTYYVWVKDEAGNISSYYETKTSSEATLTLTQSPTDWTNGNVTVTVKAENNSSYTLQTSTDNSTWTSASSNTSTTVTVSTNNTTVYAKLVDGSTTKVSVSHKVTNIDKYKPTVDSVTSESTTSLKITLSDSTSYVAGYAVTTSTTQPSTFTSTGSTSKSVTVTKSGLSAGTKYYVWAKDAAGNISSYYETKTASEATLTLTQNPTDWTNGNVTVTVTANNNSSYTLQTSTDNSTWTSASSNTSTTVTVSTNNTTVYARLVDGSTTKVAASHKVTNIDKVKPTISSVTTSATSATRFKFTVKASDADSGLSKYIITTSSTTPTVNTSGWVSNTNSEFSKDGLSASTTYYVYVQDKAGNISAAKKVTTTSLNYSIDDTSWTETLAQAVSKAKSSGSTIKLLRNYTDTSTVNISKNLTYNTNGYKLTRKYEIVIKKSATLNINGSGTIELSSNASNGTLLQNFGTLNIAGGTITAKRIGWTIVNNYDNSDGKLNITGGTINHDNDGDGSAIMNKYTMTMSGGTVNSAGFGIVSREGHANTKITGGTIKDTCSSNNAAIKVDLGGEAYIYNTTITATNRAVAIDKYEIQGNTGSGTEPTKRGKIFLYNCTDLQGDIYARTDDCSYGTIFEVVPVDGGFVMRHYYNDDDLSNAGVTVRFPTWTVNNGQDDIKWYDTKFENYSSRNCKVYWTTAYKSDHNNETGTYVTHIYRNDTTNIGRFTYDI